MNKISLNAEKTRYKYTFFHKDNKEIKTTFYFAFQL